MVGANLASALSQGAAATLLITGRAEIWHLAALAAVNGAATAFYFPASAGVIPQTVPAPILQQANALLSLAINAALIGGAAWPASSSPPSAPAGRSRSTPARSSPAPRSSPRCGFPPGSPKAWGAILTEQAIGLLVGGLVGLRFRPRRMLLAATFAILLLPAPLVALGFPLSLPTLVAAAFLAGVGSEVFGLLWHTTMQQEIPADKLSRVYSYDALGSIALVPVGYALAGPVADAGAQATLWGAAALGVAVTLAVLFVREVRTLERAPATA